MLTIEQIWEVVQRLEAEGRDQDEIEARVRELTLATTGASFGVDLLRTMVGESPIQNPLRSAKDAMEALPHILKNAPEIGKQVVGAATGLPKTIVDQLADRGPEVLLEGAMGVLNFVAEDLGRYGVGGLADPGFVGKTGRGGRALKKAEKQVRKQREAIRKAHRAEIDQLKDEFGAHEFSTVIPEDLRARGQEVRNPELDARLKEVNRVRDEAMAEVEEAETLLRQERLGPAPEGAPLAGRTIEQRLETLSRRAERELLTDQRLAEELPGDVGLFERRVQRIMDENQIGREAAEEIAQSGMAPRRPPSAGPAARRSTRSPISPNAPVVDRIARVRDDYMAAKGLDRPRIRQLREEDVDQAFHEKWAEIYNKAPEFENAPETKAAWRKMANEVQEQYEWLTARPEEGGAGISFEFVDVDPYKSHGEMIRDLQDTGRIKVFKTPRGDDAPFHPYLSPEENDIFRAVHDILGHADGTNTFDLHGETQAAWQHLSMFSPEARPAVAVETLGQNSAFYHGTNVGNFQPQKTFIPPDERLYGIGYADVADVPVTRFPEGTEAGVARWADEAPVASNLGEGVEDNILQLTDEFGGSTVDRGGENLAGTDVWATSLGEPYEKLFDAPPTPDEIRAFLDEHADFIAENPDVVIGTWDDRVGKDAHGKWELNLTKTFESQGAVRNYAMDHDQWGYLNLADPEFESVAASDAFGNARLRARLDAAVPERAERRLARFKELATPEEWQAFEKTPGGRNRSERDKERILEVFSLMPETEEGAAFALLGHEMGQWYQSSARSIHEMFGNDAPRFSALLAALSPNAAVKDNLGAALQIWGDWNNAGRPTGRAQLRKFLDQAKRDWGVTPTNLNNMERVLKADDALLIQPNILDEGGLILGHPSGAGLQEGKALLAGRKVDPFYANLMGQLQRFVMDTHMKSGFGFSRAPSALMSEAFGGQVAARGYANFLTEVTGKPWSPAEVQAAQWSAIKTLKEMSGMRSKENIPQLLQDMGFFPHGFQTPQTVDNFGELTREIQKTPAFSNLFEDPKIRAQLDKLGLKPPAVRDDMKMLDFLDDPEVRLGDLMDMAKRISQSTGDSLTGVIAMLIGQGVMDSVQGQELLSTLAEEEGITDLQGAYEMDPGGTMQMLMLMGEQPDLDEERAGRFGEVMGLAPDLFSTLRGSASRPGAGRSANVARFGPLVGRRGLTASRVPAPPIPAPRDGFF